MAAPEIDAPLYCDRCGGEHDPLGSCEEYWAHTILDDPEDPNEVRVLIERDPEAFEMFRKDFSDE
jgi:hypothetical protein